MGQTMQQIRVHVGPRVPKNRLVAVDHAPILRHGLTMDALDKDDGGAEPVDARDFFLLHAKGILCK